VTQFRCVFLSLCTLHRTGLDPRMRQDLPRESDGCARRPPPASRHAQEPRPRRCGDVTRIDRLARSTFDLLAIVKQIVDAKAHVRSLAEPWADTGASTGRLMIAALGGLADVERGLIGTRTAEGGQSGAEAWPAHGPPAETDPGAEGRDPDGAGRRVLRLPNSRAATTSARPRFRD
jgi:hypothetical protein